MITLRPYQEKLKSEVHSSWSSGAQNVLMQLVTGGGKSAILGKITEEHDGAVGVIAHRGPLVIQLSIMLATYGIWHDIIGSTETRRAVAALHILKFGKCYLKPGAWIRVISVDTFIRAKGLERWVQEVTLWITDEGHHVVHGNKWDRAIKLFTNKKVRGLLPTATPNRADGKGLGRFNSDGTPGDGLADIMVQGPPMRWLINEGYLCDYRIFCPESDLTVFADVAASGDWSQAALKDASQKSHIVGDVVQAYKRIAPGKLDITFTTDVETATNIAQAYRDAGVPAEVLTGETDERMRAGIISRFERREILQLVVVDVVSEGFDCPQTQVGSSGRPTQSRSLLDQQFGRTLRPFYAPGFDLETREGRLAAIAASDKPYAIWIDHARNIIRHGLPDAPRVWTLDHRDKRRAGESDAEKLRICTDHKDSDGQVIAYGCLQTYKAILDKCPHCSLVRPPPASRSTPAAVEGDMGELDRDVLDALRAQIPPDLATAAQAWQYLPGPAQSANAKRHVERLTALDTLRAAMATWGGVWHARGESDREIQRRFWTTFGVDILSAQGLSRAEAVALTERIDGAVSRGMADG